MKRIEQLTFTRFVIIILVLFAHDTLGHYLDPLLFFPLEPLIRSGSTGVSYLFILSGFVMALVYYKPGEKFNYLNFWRTRLIRLYPLYIMGFLLTCIYYYDDLFRIKPAKILANIFILQSWIPKYSQSFNFVAWSMTVEVFFYLFFPFFLIWTYRQPTRKLIRFSLIVWAVSTTIFQILWIGYIDQYREFILYFPLFYFNSFVMGVVGAIWYLREGRQENISTRKRLAVLAGSFLVLATYTVVSLNFYPALPHMIQPITGFLAPLLILFIVALTMDQSFISRFLVHPVLVNLGELSYAIYILHIPVKWLYSWALASAGVVDVQRILDLTFLPLILLVAFVVHFYVDTPFRKWLKGFLKNNSVRVFLLDIVVILLLGYLMFPLRFGDGREYRSYLEMERLVLWVAFLIRPLLALAFGTYRHDALVKPGNQWAVSVLLSVSLGSLVIATAAYLGYATGRFENFPRSVFVLDWLIVLAFSLLTRFSFRRLGVYRQEPLPA
ncbi:MAG: acyltransferase family protein [Chloroflexi bacterium]|nr:acyltransferase family protein [Chloroflexota bacterium]